MPGTVLYALTVLAQAVIQSEMVHGLDRRRKLKEMEKLEGISIGTLVISGAIECESTLPLKDRSQRLM